MLGSSKGRPPFEYEDVATSPPSRRRWLREVLDSGFVRETNYGKIFDVRTVPNPNNLAFTEKGLEVHTDNPYRDPVPTLQLLQSLQNDAEGGETILVDGFLAAELLRENNEQAFRLLTVETVRFRFRDTNADLIAESPVIRTDSHGRVTGVRFNSRSVQPFRLPARRMEEYYRAYRKFAEILNDPQHQTSFHLQPGELLIFDNERMLHGRSSIRENSGRPLQGCYADRDALASFCRVGGN